ncbi:MAG: hypothetical protein J0H52_21050 [Comamonadaceae bacterium]|mgnify:FL=1|nr:hypothetical protein [Comamonadaceae bacterium]
MSEPTSGVIVSPQVLPSLPADEVMAAVQPPSQADLVEFQRVTSNLDRLLVESAVDVDGVIDEFKQIHNRLRHPTE